MNTEDIIRMAQEAGFRVNTTEAFLEELKRFAALVASAERERIESRPWGAGKEWIARAVEAEREACAKVAEWEPCMADTPQRIAAAIRARGQA